MGTFEMVGGIAVAVIWIALAAYVFRLIAQIWNDRLVRCPETGAVALLTLQSRAPEGGGPARLRVRDCSQWPRQQGCAQGCLAQHPERTPVFRVNMDALRPIDKSGA